jgi:hypothetical protein
MDAEPSIICGVPGGPNVRMRIVAAITVALYVLGLPLTFGLFLLRNRTAVRADQTLRERGEGDSVLTNPNIKARSQPSHSSLSSPSSSHSLSCSCCFSSSSHSFRPPGPSFNSLISVLYSVRPVLPLPFGVCTTCTLRSLRACLCWGASSSVAGTRRSTRTSVQTLLLGNWCSSSVSSVVHAMGA